MAKTYLDLLEESLPSPGHRMYEEWKQTALNAIERGCAIKRIVSGFSSVVYAKVLDVGCGEGGTSIAFAEEQETEVYALDIDYMRVIRSRVRAREEGTSINFLVADCLNMPFKPGIFDLVICNDVMEHVPKPERLTEEIYRTLKEKGVLFVTAPNAISPYSIIHDAHYGLFGVSLMPSRIGEFYVSKIRKSTSVYGVYEPFTYWSMRGLLARRFRVSECHRDYYSGKIEGRMQSLIANLPNTLLGFVVPTLVFICERSALSG